MSFCYIDVPICKKWKLKFCLLPEWQKFGGHYYYGVQIITELFTEIDFLLEPNFTDLK